MRKDIFGKLMAFLDTLEQGKISYTLARYREEALMVSVVVPGERWEVEFLEDGSVEVERFISDGDIYGAEALDELFAKYADVDEEEDKVALAQGLELVTIADS
ncbi:MAG: hypothetical protein SVT56_12905 [Chloroflexota bacterium]|nr:hypothetical protein [Chloroflexota bacterium]